MNDDQIRDAASGSSPLRARLAAAAGTTESRTRSAERAAKILTERARQLAAPAAEERSDAGDLVVVRFVVNGEQYAIETRFVREVVAVTAVTPLPGSPDFIAGITAIRGELLVVVDLRFLLGLPGGALGNVKRLIVLGTREHELAMLAEEASDVIEIATSGLQPLPARSESQRYVRGVAPGPATFLDGAALLSDPRLIIDQTAEGTKE